jgi:hypothetical protein
VIYQKGQKIQDHRTIAKKYALGWFIPDLISSFPYFWISMFIDLSETQKFEIQFVMLVTIIRVFKVNPIIFKIEEQLTSTSAHNVILLSKLTGIIILLSHWTACGFYIISFMQ